MFGLILLIILVVLLLSFGIFCLIVSLGYPDWYKNMWKKDINKSIPQDLIAKTTIIGAICTGAGFILTLVILLISDTQSTVKTLHRAKKKKAKQGIVLVEHKLRKGPSGGSYYLQKKCTGFGKSKKCKMKKIYSK